MENTKCQLLCSSSIYVLHQGFLVGVFLGRTVNQARDRRRGSCSSFLLGKSPFHSGDCSPDLFDLSGRKAVAPLNLKSSYAHGFKISFFPKF